MIDRGNTEGGKFDKLIDSSIAPKRKKHYEQKKHIWRFHSTGENYRFTMHDHGV